MSGYPSPRYTQVPNALLDLDMAAMTNAELRVTLAIIRQTLGYHKTVPEPISYSRLMELTGLSRQGVSDGVKAALARGRIRKAGKGKHGATLYTVAFVDQSAEQTDQESTEQTSSSQASRPHLVKPVDSKKKEKEIKEKDSAPDGAGSGKSQTDATRAKPSLKTIADITPQQRTIAVQAFGMKPGQGISRRTMIRINTVVGEVRERFNGSLTIRDIEAACKRYRDKPLTIPRDAVKFAAMVQEYLDERGPCTASDLKPPSPDCSKCGGTGTVIPAGAEPGDDDYKPMVCECRRCGEAGEHAG